MSSPDSYARSLRPKVMVLRDGAFGIRLCGESIHGISALRKVARKTSPPFYHMRTPEGEVGKSATLKGTVAEPDHAGTLHFEPPELGSNKFLLYVSHLACGSFFFNSSLNVLRQ